jgi:hypothetical protein
MKERDRWREIFMDESGSEKEREMRMGVKMVIM